MSTLIEFYIALSMGLTILMLCCAGGARRKPRAYYAPAQPVAPKNGGRTLLDVVVERTEEYA